MKRDKSRNRRQKFAYYTTVESGWYEVSVTIGINQSALLHNNTTHHHPSYNTASFWLNTRFSYGIHSHITNLSPSGFFWLISSKSGYNISWCRSNIISSAVYNPVEFPLGHWPSGHTTLRHWDLEGSHRPTPNYNIHLAQQLKNFHCKLLPWLAWKFIK